MFTNIEAAEMVGKVRAVIAQGWCQGHDAEVNNGDGTYWSAPVHDPNANRWCLVGGMVKVAGINAGAELAELVGAELARLYPYLIDEANDYQAHCVVAWNDDPDRTQTQVLEFLDGYAQRLAALEPTTLVTA